MGKTIMKIDDEKRIEAIRAARENSPKTQAYKKAVALYAALQPFIKGSHNTGNLFEQKVVVRILEGLPISFTAFWGVGGKELPDSYDERFLSELESIRSSVAVIYPEGGSHIQLLLADEHGVFNQFTNPQIYGYLVRVQDQARTRGVDSIWLSDLYRKWQLAVPDSRIPTDGSPTVLKLWEDSKYFRQREQLVESARKHHQIIENAEQIAFHYAAMRLQEASFLAQTFPDTILLVNSSKDLAKLLLPPQLPHIYLKMPPVWFQETK